METLTVFTVAATPSLMLCIHMQTCPHAFQKDACGHAVTHTCSALNWNADRQGFFCDYMCWGGEKDTRMAIWVVSSLLVDDSRLLACLSTHLASQVMPR